MRHLTFRALLFAAILGSLFTTHTASAAAHARWTFTDFVSNPLTLRRVYITPIQPYGVSGNNVVIGARQTYTNDASGILIVSNIVVGFSYRVEFVQTTGSVIFTNCFDSGVSGLVDASDYLCTGPFVSGAAAAALDITLDQYVRTNEPSRVGLTNEANTFSGSYAGSYTGSGTGLSNMMGVSADELLLTRIFTRSGGSGSAAVEVNLASGGVVLKANGGLPMLSVTPSGASSTGNVAALTFTGGGAGLSNISGQNSITGAVAVASQAAHATNADLASFVSGTLSNSITGNAATATLSTNANLASIAILATNLAERGPSYYPEVGFAPIKAKAETNRVTIWWGGDSINDKGFTYYGIAAALDEKLAARFGRAGSTLNNIDQTGPNPFNHAATTNWFAQIAGATNNDNMVSKVNSTFSSGRVMNPPFVVTNIGIYYIAWPFGGQLNFGVYTNNGNGGVLAAPEIAVTNTLSATRAIRFTNVNLAPIQRHFINGTDASVLASGYTATGTNNLIGFRWLGPGPGIESAWLSLPSQSLSNCLNKGGTNLMTQLGTHIPGDAFVYLAQDGTENSDIFALSNNIISYISCFTNPTMSVFLVSLFPRGEAFSELVNQTNNQVYRNVCEEMSRRGYKWYYMGLHERFPDYTNNLEAGLMDIDGIHSTSPVGSDTFADAILDMWNVRPKAAPLRLPELAISISGASFNLTMPLAQATAKTNITFMMDSAGGMIFALTNSWFCANGFSVVNRGASNLFTVPAGNRINGGTTCTQSASQILFVWPDPNNLTNWYAR